jgi:hypothetical protein
MKILRLLIISLVILFSVITALSLLIPSTVRISRAIDLNVNKEIALKFIADPSNWHVLFSADSLPIIIESGKPIGIQMPGNKSILLAGITDSSVLAVPGMTYKKTIGKTTITWTCLPGKNNEQSVVQWYMDFKLNWYPWEKFSSLLFETNYGANMEKGLQKMKERLEQQP